MKRGGWLIAVLFVTGLLCAAFAIRGIVAHEAEATWTPTPTRVELPSSEASVTSVDEAPAPEATAEQPLEIAGSDILHVDIPAVAVDIDVSGFTEPRESPNCRGGVVLCIDPPIGNQAAWYSVTPALPSTGTVRIFAHNTPRDWPVEQSFNNLPAMAEGDDIIVTTETGVFTYRAEAPQLVPYVDVPESELVWGNAPDRLVLVTCNNAADSGTIVEAWLVSAVPR